MKSKVTLRETIGIKIVYALLIVCYYWMWARRDWHSYYEVIQHIIIIFTVVFFALRAGRICRHGREEKDELAVQNLRRTDALGLKIVVAADILIAFACAVTFIDGKIAGYALVGTVLALAIIRFVIFYVMDSKGV